MAGPVVVIIFLLGYGVALGWAYRERMPAWGILAVIWSIFGWYIASCSMLSNGFGDRSIARDVALTYLGSFAAEMLLIDVGVRLRARHTRNRDGVSPSSSRAARTSPRGSAARSSRPGSGRPPRPSAP